MLLRNSLCGIIRLHRPFDEDMLRVAQELLLTIGDLNGMHVEFIDQIGGAPPILTTSQSRGEPVFSVSFFFLSLQLMMEEALISVQLLSGHRQAHLIMFGGAGNSI